MEVLLNSDNIVISLFLFLIAILYSSVGHGGASGYLAVLAFAEISTASMRSTALILNVLVATIASIKFIKSGSFSLRIFLPLIVTSIPMAFLGGKLELPEHIYRPIVGVILLLVSLRIITEIKNGKNQNYKTPSSPVLLLVGAGLGFLSGLTGIGGGIFLSPLLYFLHWAPLKVISGIAASFVLVNSISGILGISSNTLEVHNGLPLWLVAVLLGGLIGAEFGSKRLENKTIQWLLSIVTIVGALKMIFSF